MQLSQGCLQVGRPAAGYGEHHCCLPLAAARLPSSACHSPCKVQSCMKLELEPRPSSISNNTTTQHGSPLGQPRRLVQRPRRVAAIQKPTSQSSQTWQLLQERPMVCSLPSTPIHFHLKKKKKEKRKETNNPGRPTAPPSLPPPSPTTSTPTSCPRPSSRHNPPP